ncbi:MAG: flagellar basal body rod protein FlgC [Thermoanaerobacterales bacterium]|nr:flagellar basal body rod protein FlgC [Thermoanaerobacterales bacterium]
MGYFDSFGISASGLTAERLRLDIVANNLANAETTRTPQGGPYRRQTVVFAQRLQRALHGWRNAGVQVTAIVQDDGPPRTAYEPDHPDARADGYVEYPNVNVVNEMIDMLSATRAYEANAAALQATKQLASYALEMGR